MTMHRLSSILFYILTIVSFLFSSRALVQHQPKKIRVQVCQNKDCCQRFSGEAQNLVQTIKHLCPPNVEVESSACLSQCGNGPNICIQMNGEETFHGNIADAASAGAVMEIATDVTIHPTLVAAVNVMERACKAQTLEEKERFLTSVITALEKKDELKDSHAVAHAHAMRAKLYVKKKEYNHAVDDARRAVKLDPTNDQAWRTLADAHEASGNLQGAVEALRQWSKARPSFSTKAKKEMQKLSELL